MDNDNITKGQRGNIARAIDQIEGVRASLDMLAENNAHSKDYPVLVMLGNALEDAYQQLAPLVD